MVFTHSSQLHEYCKQVDRSSLRTLPMPLARGMDPGSFSFLERLYDLRNVLILFRTQDANSGNLALASAIISDIKSRGWWEMGTSTSSLCSMIPRT